MLQFIKMLLNKYYFVIFSIYLVLHLIHLVCRKLNKKEVT